MSIIPQVYRVDESITIGELLYRIQRLEAWVTLVDAQFDIKVTSDELFYTAGDSKFVFMVPRDLDGWLLNDVEAFLSTVGSTDTVAQVRNITTGFDMLTTPITIDAGEFTTCSTYVPPVIDATHDDVSHCDLIAIDIDDVGLDSKGLGVILTFTAPG